MVEWLGGSSENTVQFSVSNKYPKKDKVSFAVAQISCTTTRLQQFTDKEGASLLCCNYVSSISNAAKPAYRLSVDALSQTTSATFRSAVCRPPCGHSISALARRRRVDPCPDVRTPYPQLEIHFHCAAHHISWRFTQGHYPDRQIDSHLTSWQSRSPLHVYSVAGQTLATPARVWPARLHIVSLMHESVEYL